MAEKKAETKNCSKCKEDRKLTEYYMAASDLIHSDGKLPICKKCLDDVAVFENVDSFKNVLRNIDRPFLTDTYEASIVSKPNNPFGEYMRRLGMIHNKNLTWANSDFKSSIDNNALDGLELDFDEKKTMQELIKFFGRGFDSEDYYWLYEEYEDYLNRYECDSKSMEVLIKEICITQLDIKKRRALSEKVDAQLKTLQDLLGSSSLKPVQETGANSVDQESFGTLIKKYENERPIPEPEEKWKDVDNIGKYIRVFFLGHLTRMLGIKNDYEDEYWDEVNKHTVDEPEPEEDDGVIIGSDR